MPSKCPLTNVCQDYSPSSLGECAYFDLNWGECCPFWEDWENEDP
jgi:hypothetical protein